LKGGGKITREEKESQKGGTLKEGEGMIGGLGDFRNQKLRGEPEEKKKEPKGGFPDSLGKRKTA